VTPEDLRHLAQAVARAADEVGGGLGQLIQGWADSMLLLATGFDQNLRPGTSAEQLSIALMAEARKLYAQANISARPGQLEELTASGDRLAKWATDARQLGVQHFRAVTLEKQTALMAVERMGKAEVRLGRVQEAMKGWQRLSAVHQLAHKIGRALDE
jgi:methyl-accepting chemotaxis protein